MENLKDVDSDDDQYNDNEESVKVVLIGESGVGKTSIIAQFINRNFNQDLMTTNGATFSTKSKVYKELKKIITFEMWDTAGQEKYRSLSQLFFKDASVALIIYDITSKPSFEEIKNYWLNLVKENSPKNIIIYIIGNKYDLLDRETVKEEEAREFAKNENIFFWLTSAKDAVGIDDLFDDIGKRYLSPEFSENPENIERKMRKNEINKIDSNSGNNSNKKKKKKCCG